MSDLEILYIAFCRGLRVFCNVAAVIMVGTVVVFAYNHFISQPKHEFPVNCPTEVRHASDCP